MVLLTATPLHLTIISSLPPSSLSRLSTSSHPLPKSTSDPIAHSTLITLSRLARTTLTPPKDAQQYALNSLLCGTTIYQPTPTPSPPKSPEYSALMARLRAEAEARSYASLISKQEQQTQIGPFTAIGEEKDDITPSLVFNILLSIIMCGAAVWVMTRWWRSDGLRVLMSLATGLVVGVAEVVVYSGYLRKVKLAREKERGRKERNEVLQSEVVGGGGVPMGGIEGDGEVEEKEEIWGRGPNGGMRRRVREKWERRERVREEEKS